MPRWRTDAPPGGNLYAQPEFIDVLGEVFHPGHACRPADVAVGREVYRLPWIEGRGPVPDITFVDYHEPVGRLNPAAGWSLRPGDTRGQRLHRLPRLRPASRGLVALDDWRAQARGEALGAPVVLWRGFTRWEDYLTLLRTRRVLAEDQRRRRRLEALAGPLRFAVDDLGSDVLPTCFDWKSARDRAADRAELFASEAPRRFFGALRARGLLRASTLRAGDGQLLSVWLGALHAERWTGWVFAFNPDPALARFSPGRQLLYTMLEESWRAGHHEFDFSIGLEPYKLSFATHVRVLGTAGRPPAGERLAALAHRLLAHRPGLLQALRGLRRRVRIS
jgi:CelD/BcsL family acetyltransferase involved in cellulose biosynthesis